MGLIVQMLRSVVPLGAQPARDDFVASGTQTLFATSAPIHPALAGATEVTRNGLDLTRRSSPASVDEFAASQTGVSLGAAPTPGETIAVKYWRAV